MVCSVCGSALAPQAILCGECGSSVTSHSTSGVARSTAPADTSVLDPSRRTWLPGLSPGRHRLSPGVPIAASVAGAVQLSFVSGQRAIVTGNGLIGRQPLPDPGESFRHLLTVTDAARSLSKTHLEFGFDEEGLWVRDRWSANGSILVVPAQAPLPLEAGRRYRAKVGSLLVLSTTEIMVESVDHVTSGLAGGALPQRLKGDDSEDSRLG